MIFAKKDKLEEEVLRKFKNLEERERERETGFNLSMFL